MTYDIEEDINSYMGSILLDPDILHETTVTAEMLGASQYAPASRLYLIMQEQQTKKVSIDFQSLWVDIGKRKDSDHNIASLKEYLVKVSNYVPSASNWSTYAARIVDFWGKREVLRMCKILLEMDGPSVSLSDLSNQIDQTISKVSLIESGYKIETARDVLPRVINTIEERHKAKGALIGITTGLSELDRCTFGMLPGSFWIIGGRPSDGKSAIKNQIVRAILKNTNVSIGDISLESSNNEIGMRHISSLSGVSQSAINTGFLTTAHFSQITDAASIMYDYDTRMSLYDKPSIDIRELCSVARRMAKKYGIRVLFVDYLQLINVKGTRNRFETVAAASMALKALARDLNITVVALAQLGRDADNGRPHMGDLQYSSQLEQDGDVILALWHDKDKSDPSNNDLTKSYVLILKARDGIVGDIKVKFDKPKLTFSEISQDIT